MMLMLHHPKWSTDDVLAELASLGFELPTRLLVSSVKSHFKASLKVLIEAGVIDPDPQPTAPLHPDLRRKEVRKVRRTDPTDLPYKHYYGGKDD